ncbi:methylthioribose-1-phosphate isomerase [Actinomycetospora sp. NBRC 106375]|uniref:S-methyl-5-thioribose-1-phosphate isomerase n=1 Tax=Actinomycetospora sp. NBRC 106375 TaxID=3032207 RepID=UPI0024A17B52|nr:S-methyl-5-thioribose-1-phosphate isomerase [Actinomycetospora sp. NBRC 106375]GLZ48099.1 methylthioribose-1-phosphate isomerase [Actinomycetospora sp. NBRC 106375]
MARTVDWDEGDGPDRAAAVLAIDQRALPGEYRVRRLASVDTLIDAIADLTIRGAPALGATGALGVALAARRHPGDPDTVRAEAERVAAVRPTAVNLRRGVERALARLDDGADAVVAEACAVLDEDEATNRRLGTRAADVLTALGPDCPLRLLTHCNAGALATVTWGTALGAVRELAERGRVAEVLACETRPLLQGARLTVWELREMGVAHRLLVDGAAASAMARGLVDAVVVGADRIAANGDVANKIGTYALACAAAQHGVPVVVVAPEATVDRTTASGADIVIEERAADEVRGFAGVVTAPPDTPVYNPAFDVTPAALLAAVVTEGSTFRGGAWAGEKALSR